MSLSSGGRVNGSIPSTGAIVFTPTMNGIQSDAASSATSVK